jgi:hypothetical protein
MANAIIQKTKNQKKKVARELFIPPPLPLATRL